MQSKNRPSARHANSENAFVQTVRPAAALAWAVWLCLSSACTRQDCPGGAVQHNGLCSSKSTSLHAGAADAGHDAGNDAAWDELDAAPLEIVSSDAATAATVRDAGHTDAGKTSDAGQTTRDAGHSTRDAAQLDPCKAASCDPIATCTVTQGKALCKCPVGYTGDGSTCKADPCYMATGATPVCGANATCTPAASATAGFTCACAPHFGDCDAKSAMAVAGCETNLDSSSSHCGACGAACAGDLQCMQGACAQIVQRLAAGDEGTCALAQDPNFLSAVRYYFACWGRNGVDTGSSVYDLRLLASPGFSGLSYAEPIAGPPGQFVRELAMGSLHVCAVSGNEDSVMCWGANNHSELGTAGSVKSGTWITTKLQGVTHVAVGANASYALASGKVWAWGDNQRGELGSGGTEASSATPQLVNGIGDKVVVQIRAAANAACALTREGSVYCWGFGQLNGDKGAQPILLAATSTPLADAVEIEMGSDAFETYGNQNLACALRRTGDVVCWGGAWEQPAGIVSSPSSGHADAVVTPSGVTQIAVGYAHLCMLRSSGEVQCLGSHADTGSLGFTTDKTTVSTASVVSGIDDAIELVAGGFHTCVRRKSGQVQCWGRNSQGEVGNGVAILQSTPANVVGAP